MKHNDPTGYTARHDAAQRAFVGYDGPPEAVKDGDFQRALDLLWKGISEDGLIEPEWSEAYNLLTRVLPHLAEPEQEGKP